MPCQRSWQSSLTSFDFWTSAQIWYCRCQISFVFGKSEATCITSHIWLILLILGQATPKTSQLVRAFICICYRAVTCTHYYPSRKTSWHLKTPATVRCLLGTWYEAVITTFLSQPNTETREEKMFAFLRSAIFQQMGSITNQMLTEHEDSQSEQHKVSVPTGTWTKHLLLLEVLGLSAELLAIILSKFCKQRWYAHKRGTQKERWLKNCWDSSVSTKLQVGNGCGSALESQGQLFYVFWWALKQTLEHSCPVDTQTFKWILRMPQCLHMAEVTSKIQLLLFYMTSINDSSHHQKYRSFFNLKINLPPLPPQPFL